MSLRTVSQALFLSACLTLAPGAHAGAAGGAPIEARPALHISLGSDSNACGITVPAGKPRNPARLIVWLHGGMGGRNREKGLEAHRALVGFADPGAYLCSPSASAGEEWPTERGLAHIDALIGYMLAHYPIDPARIDMAGVSDGNLGIIAYALRGNREIRHRVLISSAPQLILPAEALPGQIRLRKGTWDFLQGGKDRLFPADQVIPYLKRWESLYPNAYLHYFPEGGHDFSYYADQAPGLLKTLFSEKKEISPPRANPRKTEGIQSSPGKS